MSSTNTTFARLHGNMADLGDGFRRVVQFLDRSLPPEWEIYVRPHLNGLRPDLVLLNPDVGIGLIAVVEWDLGTGSYRVGYGTHGFRRLEQHDPATGTDASIEEQNPIQRLSLWKQEICQYYCPTLNADHARQVVFTAVVFPNADKQAALRLLQPWICPTGTAGALRGLAVSGAAELAAGDLSEVFPPGLRARSLAMTELAAASLRSWLTPSRSTDCAEVMELTPAQRSLVESRTTTGYRRIRGPAGSGKSLVLAARAGKLSAEGKQVLVVTYNVSLFNYLRSLAIRLSPITGYVDDHVTWINFHGWCSRFCQETGYWDSYRSLFGLADRKNEKRLFQEEIPRLLAAILDARGPRPHDLYDALLVDEGQDFLPLWWNVLRSLVRQEGECVLAADITQDVFGNGPRWTDQAMRGAGFSGEWSELKQCFRMEATAAQLARSFAERFLPEPHDLLPAANLNQPSLQCETRWIQTTEDLKLEAAEGAVLNYLGYWNPRLRIPHEVFVLVAEKHFGFRLAAKLRGRGVTVFDTFGGGLKEEKEKKCRLAYAKAQVKITTFYSFKGWEAPALVLVAGDRFDERNLRLLYTGITRLKRDPAGSYLSVVSALPQLEEFGRSWDRFIIYPKREGTNDRLSA